MPDLKELAKQQLKANGKKAAKNIAVKVLIPILPYILIILLVVVIIAGICGGFDVNTHGVRDVVSGNVSDENGNTIEVIKEYDGYATFNKEAFKNGIKAKLNNTDTQKGTNEEGGTTTFIDYSGTSLDSMGLGTNEDEAIDYLEKFIIAEYTTSYMHIDDISGITLNSGESLINGAIHFERYDSDGNKRSLRILTAAELQELEGKVDQDLTLDDDEINRLTEMIDNGYYVSIQDGEIKYFLYSKDKHVKETGEVSNADDALSSPTTETTNTLKIKEQKVNYKTIAANYGINFEFFMALTNATNCPEYAAALADYVTEYTDITIAIQDSKKTITHTEEFVYDVTYSYTEDEVYARLQNKANSDASLKGDLDYAINDAENWNYYRIIQNSPDFWGDICGRIGTKINEINIDETDENEKNAQISHKNDILAHWRDHMGSAENNYEKLQNVDNWLATQSISGENLGSVYDNARNEFWSFYHDQCGYFQPTADEILLGVDYKGDGKREGGFIHYYTWKTDYYDPEKTSKKIYKVVKTDTYETGTSFSYVKNAFSWFLNTKNEDDSGNPNLDVNTINESIPETVENRSHPSISHNSDTCDIQIDAYADNSRTTISTLGNASSTSSIQSVKSDDRIKINETTTGNKYSLPIASNESDNSAILLGFWKNANGDKPVDSSGKIKSLDDLKAQSFDINNKTGKEVLYHPLNKQDDGTYKDTISPGFELSSVSGQGVLSQFLSSTPEGQVQETVMKYLIHLYTGEDLGVTEVNIKDLKFYARLGMNKFSTIQGDSVEAKVWYALKASGWSDMQVAAAMGNVAHESSFITNNIENAAEATYGGDVDFTRKVNDGDIDRDTFVNGKYNGDKIFGYGLVQWTAAIRKAALYDRAKDQSVSIDDPYLQIQLFADELNNLNGVWAPGMIIGSYNSTDWFDATSDEYDEDLLRKITISYCHIFERPAGTDSDEGRVQSAISYYKQFSGK